MHETVDQEIQFESNGNVLAGSVLFPRGEGPWPGVVTLQGSGATERDNFGYFPAIWEIFLGAGVAILAYDKPGVGGSSGDWRDQNLTERAEEALDAIRFMKGLPEIDSSRVGLFGHSQGGWVAPIAAARAPDEVAFIVVQSGPGISSQEQCIHDVEHSMRGDGHPEESIQAGVAYMRSLVAAAERNDSYETVHADVLTANQGQPWWDYFSVPDANMWDYFRRCWREDSDPREVWLKVRCPVLAIFGESDHLLPVEKSVTVYRQALADAGNTDVTIEVLPGANHQFLVALTDHLMPGYAETIMEWLAER